MRLRSIVESRPCTHGYGTTGRGGYDGILKYTHSFKHIPCLHWIIYSLKNIYNILIYMIILLIENNCGTVSGTINDKMHKTDSINIINCVSVLAFPRQPHALTGVSLARFSDVWSPQSA